jgi:hypothetical protein
MYLSSQSCISPQTKPSWKAFSNSMKKDNVNEEELVLYSVSFKNNDFCFVILKKIYTFVHRMLYSLLLICNAMICLYTYLWLDTEEERQGLSCGHKEDVGTTSHLNLLL